MTDWTDDYQIPFERDPNKIYAGDLRAAGMEISDSIPDCAHVPRGSIRIGEPQIEIDEEDTAHKTVRMQLPVEFTRPFEWITLLLSIPEDER
jgi:hypothetical protein